MRVCLYTRFLFKKKKINVCSIEIGQILTFTKLIMVMYVTFRILCIHVLIGHQNTFK